MAKPEFLGTSLIQDECSREIVSAYLKEQMDFAVFIKNSLNHGVERERPDAELNRLLQTHRDLCGDKKASQ